MQFEIEEVLKNGKEFDQIMIDTVHYRILYVLEESGMTSDNNEERGGIVELMEDKAVEQPSFLRDKDLDRTVEARWNIPCVVRAKDAFENKCYSVYYNPQVFALAKNIEFKRVVAEHAIKSACGIEYVPKYSILPTIERHSIERPTRPRHELCLYSSSFCARQYFQLNVWLPKIISYQSILLECSVTNVFIQTEKPFEYVLTIKWPHQLVGHKIIFCSFIKKERRLAIVAEKLNLIEESEEESQSIESCTENTKEVSEFTFSSISQIPESPDMNLSEMCSYTKTSLEENYAVYKTIKERKNLNVKFSSLDSCVVFQDCEPVVNISERSKVDIPSKTKDGCSTKRYTYQMNKKVKSDSNGELNKPNGKSKCGGRKKR